MPDRPMTLDQVHLRRYARLFVNRWDAYLDTARTGSWVCRRQPLSGTLLLRALVGRQSLGLYSVDIQGLSRWACLDLDDNARGALLWRVIEQLEDPAQALLEVSRRGFHLWLFVEPSPWFAVRRWALHLANVAHLRGIEIFPKGEGMNGVRAPLTRHPKDGQTYPVIDPATGEIAADPWELIYSRRRAVLPVDLPTSERASTPAIQGRTDHRELVAEVERYTHLRAYGPERAIGRCPFHDDRHPSFGVMGGFWRCFAGCGEGGLDAFRARMREHQIIAKLS